MQAFLKDLQHMKRLVDSRQAAPQSEDMAKLQAFITGQRRIMSHWDAGRVEYIPATTRALQLHNQRYPKHIVDAAHATMLACFPSTVDPTVADCLAFNLLTAGIIAEGLLAIACGRSEAISA